MSVQRKPPSGVIAQTNSAITAPYTQLYQSSRGPGSLTEYDQSPESPDALKVAPDVRGREAGGQPSTAEAKGNRFIQFFRKAVSFQEQGYRQRNPQHDPNADGPVRTSTFRPFFTMRHEAQTGNPYYMGIHTPVDLQRKVRGKGVGVPPKSRLTTRPIPRSYGSITETL